MLVAFMPYPVSKWHALPPQPRYALNPITPGAVFGDPSNGGLAGAFHRYLEARFLKDVSGSMRDMKEKEKQLTLRILADGIRGLGVFEHGTQKNEQNPIPE